MTDLSEFGLVQADLLKHNAIAEKHFDTLHAIKDYIKRGMYEAAHEAWEELPHEDQIVLNRAWTKGGLLRPHERSIAVKGLDLSTEWQYTTELT